MEGRPKYPFKGLNEKLVCIRPGLIVVGARSGMGKTAFACEVILEAAKTHQVLMLSLEMSVESLISRLISYVSGLPTDQVWTYPDSLEVMQARQFLAGLHLDIDDHPVLTPMHLGERIRVTRRQPDLVIIDYLQMMTRTQGPAEMVQTYIDLCREIREHAKKFKLPIMVLSQLRRAMETSYSPKMSDLFGGTGIEQAADVILLLNRPYDVLEDHEEETYIKIAKNREGPVGVVPLKWDSSIGRWREVDERSFE